MQGLAVGDGESDLAWLLCDQASPNGVALGPDILTLIIKPLDIAVHHHGKGHAIQAHGQPTIFHRCARVIGDGMELRGIPHFLHTLIEQIAQNAPLRVRRAANLEIIGGIAPIFAQPIAIGLKPAG